MKRLTLIAASCFAASGAMAQVSGGGQINSVASGAYLSGSIAAGALSAGASVDIGTYTDTTTYAGSGNMTLLAGIRGIYNVMATGAIPAGTNTIGGVFQAPTSSAANGITPNVSGSAASGVVLKASAGNLYSVYVTTTAPGWLMVFNSATVPADGATTAGTASGNLVECVAVPSGVTTGISFSGVPPEPYSVGISAAFSSTACATKTASTTALIHGAAQ